MNGRINTNSCVEIMILNINTQVNVLYSGATKGFIFCNKDNTYSKLWERIAATVEKILKIMNY